MLDNLTLLAVLIILAWLLAIGYYFYLRRQQGEIDRDLDELRALLDEEDAGDK